MKVDELGHLYALFNHGTQGQKEVATKIAEQGHAGGRRKRRVPECNSV